MGWVASDGFDAYNGLVANTGLWSKWSPTGSSWPGMALQPGRFGGQCLQLSGSGNSMATRALTAPRTSGANGIALRNLAYPGSNAMLAGVCFMQGPTYQFSVRCNMNGGLDVFRLSAPTAGALLGSSALGLCPLNTWQYMEVLWTCGGGTSGSIQVLLDGTPVPGLNLSGINNQNAGSPTVDSLRLDASFAPNPAQTWQADDYNEGDAPTTMGALRNETLRPASDNSIAWTPNSGANNFSRVNETLVDGDTSYVQTATVGARDLYGFGPLSSTPAAIAGVQASSFAYKTDAGIHTMNNSVKSGATSSDGAAFTLPSSYAKFERPMAVDPNTGVAWTPAAIAALLAGPTLAS